MQPHSFEWRVLHESDTYLGKRPYRVPSADSPSRPNLKALYAKALEELQKRPAAKWFALEGVQYGIVYEGRRMCVMHRPTHRTLVGQPVRRNE
jgi:hypothetical protein